MKTNNLQFYGSLLFLLAVLLLPCSDADVDCNELTESLSPCLSYLTNSSSYPSAACCSAAGNLASIAASRNGSDLQAACYCLVSAATRLSVDETAAEDLASRCGINLKFPISAQVNCSQLGS